MASASRPPVNARWWIATIPAHQFTPYLPASVAYVRGQLEQSNGTEYLHWQFVIAFGKSVRLSAVRKLLGPWHYEPTKSDAALEYVWKDDTAVASTRFELGEKPISRSRERDWDAIREAAKRGRLEEIPADIYIRSYHSLSRIAADNAMPEALERKCYVFWGATGTGKSRRAWQEAGLDAYPKDPRNKFWCGYREQTNVVIDEFRGDIDIAHMLRWTDRYPVIIEVKGGSRVLRAQALWITSNLDPRNWYPGVDAQTLAALMRRLTITHFNENI